jgi:Tol biopolymer transport system component
MVAALNRQLPAFVIPLILAAAGATVAEAQQFGRNKVQYKDFEFEVVTTEHFRIYRYPEEQAATDQAARMAERWYARLSQLLDHELRGPQPVLLYASHPDFEQTNAIAGLIDEGTGGVTESLKRRIVLPLAGSLAETDHVLGHELVHAFQYDLASAERMGEAALNRLPLWFIEGMAEYLSIGPVDPHTAMWIRDASREETLPEIRKLDDPRLFPYRWGHALWAYVAGRWGDEAVGRAYDEALRSGSAVAALEAVTGLTQAELSTDWHAAIRAQYAAVLADGRPASAFGRLVSRPSSDERSISVSPALSPDGRRIVYFSERGLLSIDLYLADVETGSIIRRLTNTAVDPHITSLQFISSAGSWHPDGRQFVAGTVRNGAAELTILDAESGDTIREIPLPDLGEVLNPSWSPKGDAVVFSATRGGWSDLYVYDLERASLRQITSDAFADLQPAWAPDGARIAFVTDRFTTHLPSLKAGEYGLALVDPATAAVEALPTFATGKAISPQWEPDGRRLFFLSDRGGLTDLYSIDVRSHEIRQVTGLNTGASGITALSPALSAAAQSRRVAFSAYEHGHLGVYVIDAPQVLAGSPPGPDEGRAAAALPPQQRASTTVASMLADAARGLPAEPGAAEPYRPRLSLDFVGQPYVSAGVSSFGPTYGGGITFVTSDMLGNHQLVASIDANTYGTGLSDLAGNIGGVLAYENRGGRWNWGVAAEQTPSIAGGFLSGLTTSGGQPALVEQSIIQRQVWRGASGVAAYPFSRTRRVEFGGGYRHLTFDEQVRTVVTSLQTGDVISDDTVTNQLAAPLDLATAGVAAVIDRSVFGATSPIDGERARFEISPTVGSIDFTTALLDYRRYFMPARFYTIAGRVMHVGRYGAGGEDTRLLPLFLGYPDLMRGYGIGSYEAAECTVTAASDCPEFDRLIGSRLLVGNLELRFPLLRPFGVRSGMYGPIPVEVAFFADAGVAWMRADRPSFAGGDRRGVSSAGVTFRVNVFGFAVAQIDFARPFQRPGRGWVWAFSLTPGY